LLINGTDKAEGLEMIEVEFDEDEVTVQKVADGTAIYSTNPSRSGTIKFQIIEASATNDVMWTLRKNNTSFSIGILDPTAPNLTCRGAKCRIGKPPVIKRGLECDIVEWTCICTYLDARGGSYSLASA
jgi:hypothetical protein